MQIVNNNSMFHHTYKIVLASKSPRRQQLLEQLNLPFTVRTKDTDEAFSAELKAQEIPIYLSEKKAAAFANELANDELLITADTVVWIDNKVLNKPADEAEALQMLQLLNGNMHQVFTGVCLKTNQKQISFYDETKVWFSKLSDDELKFYINNYKPFDKAGSYGAQDWIGLVGINKLSGSYFNVMGLPVHLLYQNLKLF